MNLLLKIMTRPRLFARSIKSLDRTSGKRFPKVPKTPNNKFNLKTARSSAPIMVAPVGITVFALDRGNVAGWPFQVKQMLDRLTAIYRLRHYMDGSREE